MSENALTILAGIHGQLAPNARQVKHADQDLGAGIQAPFAVIGYKGGHWSVRHRGNTKVLERFDDRGRPDGFVPFLDLIVLYAASHHSKTYYKDAYVEGSDQPPDCWSTDGQKPDQAAPQKQNPTCGDCRHNAFGSRVNAATGAKGKACADFRRWAVVPYEDIENTIMGGPMLLRIPPASLGGVGEYSDMLKANSVPYAAIATRVGFDGKEAYPKMVFQPLAALTESEVSRARKMQDHPLVERIVSEQIENMTAQVGSEQGTIVTPAADRSETKVQGNGVTGPVSDARVTDGARLEKARRSVFGQVDTTGPSYQGQKTAAETSRSAVASNPQPAPENAQAVKSEALTPEQLKIRDLEAQLAAAKATPGRAPRKRSQPVSPQAQAEPHAAAAPEEEADEPAAPADDPALANISARLEKLL